MKVLFNTLAVGPDFCYQSGQIADISEDFAKALINGGYAVSIDEPVALKDKSRSTIKKAQQGDG